MPGPLRIETFSGQPVTLQGRRLIPFHQVVSLDFPGMRGGLVWNRPVSVWEIAPDGSERVIPIPDVTRRAMLSILGIVVLVALLRWMAGR